MNVSVFLKTSAEGVEAVLESYLDTWDGAPAKLDEAIRYSLFAGGKRLRPALVLEAARVVGGDESAAMPAACALEMIHTYSLVHDDLPAMDDDDLRRGKPTSHKQYDEATAILVGDALLTMAFDVAAQTGNVEVIREIARAAGVAGMVGGQFLDIESEGMGAGIEDLQHLHRCKTGALICVSLRCGAMLGEATDEQLSALTDYGQRIGLAFQIADDILDVEGDEASLGKPVGSDEANAKSTYPALLGLEQARIMSREAGDKAVAALAGFGSEADTLRGIARYIVERQH
jgi:geranylgeranyl diphosphate synthase type II